MVNKKITVKTHYRKIGSRLIEIPSYNRALPKNYNMKKHRKKKNLRKKNLGASLASADYFVPSGEEYIISNLVFEDALEEAMRRKKIREIKKKAEFLNRIKKEKSNLKKAFFENKRRDNKGKDDGDSGDRQEKVIDVKIVKTTPSPTFKQKFKFSTFNPILPDLKNKFKSKKEKDIYLDLDKLNKLILKKKIKDALSINKQNSFNKPNIKFKFKPKPKLTLLGKRNSR